MRPVMPEAVTYRSLVRLSGNLPGSFRASGKGFSPCCHAGGSDLRVSGACLRNDAQATSIPAMAPMTRAR